MKLVAFDASPTFACLALFAGTFVQEATSLAAGAVLILGGDLPAALVALSLYLGIVTGDCSIYGLGALARKSAWARRMIAGVNFEGTKVWLEKRLPIAVATSHLVPFVLFPTFVTFGWFAVPFRRFALTSAIFNALYVPTVLIVLTTVGRAAWPYLKSNVWILWLVIGTIVTVSLLLQWRRARA